MDKKLIETFVSAGIKDERKSIFIAVLNLDIICCESIAKEESYSSYRNRVHELINKFSDANYADAQSRLEGFVKTNRKYFKFFLDGREDLTFGNAYRGTVHSWILFLISQKKPITSWKKEIENYTSDFRDSWYKKTREEIIEEYVDSFRTVYKDLTTDDLNRIFDLSNIFSKVAAHYKKILYGIYENDNECSAKYTKMIVKDHLASNVTVQTYSKKKEEFFESKENKIILQCMAEYYLSITPNSSKQTWHAFLHNTWKKFYPGVEFSDTIQNKLDDLLGVFTDNNSDNRKPSTNFQRYMCKLRLNGTPVPLLRNGYSIFNGTKYR